MQRTIKRVGITGQNGFVGYHLSQTIQLLKDEFTLVPFDKEDFNHPERLANFVSGCDVIVHLAAKNRHADQEVIYQTNVGLVKLLIEALDTTGSTPHVLFSSSTQEERDNPYGRSKKEGRELLERWATDSGGKCTGLVIPNVFGPFGHPYYNSVVATFCHQLTHGEQPKIDMDGDMKLIYVAELVKEFLDAIRHPPVVSHMRQVTPTASCKVSELLHILSGYQSSYFEKGAIPDLTSTFHRNLFITFLTYIDHRRFFPFPLTKNSDARGTFVETVRIGSGGQVSFSTTVPGITRGNHFHTRKAERFAVIKGRARIELRKIGSSDVLAFELDGAQPSFVDMPVWYTHNITNIGDEELYTIFWINEFYDPADPDTFFVTV